MPAPQVAILQIPYSLPNQASHTTNISFEFVSFGDSCSWIWISDRCSSAGNESRFGALCVALSTHVGQSTTAATQLLSYAPSEFRVSEDSPLNGFSRSLSERLVHRLQQDLGRPVVIYVACALEDATLLLGPDGGGTVASACDFGQFVFFQCTKYLTMSQKSSS